jgi:hypothetical protein
MNPFFLWDTYLNGALSGLNQVFLILTFGILLLYYMNKNKITKKIFFISTIVITVWLQQRMSGAVFNFAFGSVLTILIIIMFINLSDNLKKDIYDKFITILALSLISGIFVWIIYTIGIDLPFNKLIPIHAGKVAKGTYYYHFFGSIFLQNENYPMVNRLCGVFDEPGVMGTFSALILVGNHKNKKDWRNIIFFIAGLFTLSLAFILILLITYFVNNLKKGLLHITIIAFLVTFIYFIFINIDINIDFIETLQNRITFQDGDFVGNNRTEESFDIAYNNFLKGNDGNRLLGNGINASINNPDMLGSYTYKMLIYDFGFLGFFLLIICFILIVYILYRRNIDCYILLFVFLISIYQRPYVMNLSYMVVLFGGCSMLSYAQEYTFEGKVCIE